MDYTDIYITGVNNIIIELGKPVALSGHGPNRDFLRYELIHIPKDTNPILEWVSK